MKRGISLPLCLAVVVLAAACGGQGAPHVPPGEGVSPPSGTGEVPIVGGSTVSATVPVGSGVSSVTGTTLVRLPVPVMESVTPVVEEISGGGFISVSAGWRYSCGLRVDRSVECWEFRTDWLGRTRSMLDRSSSDLSGGTPPGGELAMVDAGWGYACGIRPTGGVECWRGDPVALDPPVGEFTSVSAGLEHACALRPGGEVECWGYSSPRKGVLVLPDGPFTSIAAGSGFLCGLRPSGEVECWGRGYGEGEASPPPGEFKSISGGGGSDMCGLRRDGSVECWMHYSLPGEQEEWDVAYLRAPGGVFEQVELGVAGSYTCGLRPGGEAECWNRYDSVEVDGPPKGEKYIDLAVWRDRACGVRLDHTRMCWDQDAVSNDNFIPGDDKFINYESGISSFSCGVRIDGTIECLGGRRVLEETGWTEWERLSAPPGVFTSVSVGSDYACGLHPDGGVECWGSDWGSDEFGKLTPPGGVFTQITTSRDFACGLRPSGGVECWGGSGFLRRQSKVVPPRERLMSVDAGWGGWYNPSSPTSSVRHGGFMDWGYSCGLREDGTALCWGDGGSIGGSYSILSPPGGVFEEIEVGMWRACGLRPGGSVECWGNIDVADEETGWTYADGYVVYEADPSGGGGFVDVELGAWHACGLRPDGGVYCWNWRRDVMHTDYVLEGPYVSISAGFSHTCGLHPDGGIDCWWLTSKDLVSNRVGGFTATSEVTKE